VFSLNGDRAATRPYGLFGGQPGASARCMIHRREGTVERIAPATMKAQRIAVHPGDVVVIEGTSGGGYGNPLERPVESVARDVRDGLLSAERAKRDYGVVLDTSGAIDLEATASLRARLSARFHELAERLPMIDRDGYSLIESESESESAEASR
jgi:N-methylhydantoinase B